MKHPYPYAPNRPHNATEDEYLFDQARADKVREFLQEAITLNSGIHAGKKMRVLKWQEKLFTEVFGTIKWSEELQQYIRQYTKVSIWVPRKNGKSTILAALGLYLSYLDTTGRATVLVAAGTRQQAKEIFDQAKAFVKGDEWLNEMFKIRDGGQSGQEIEHISTAGKMRVVATDEDTNLGSAPTAVLFDEVAIQKNGDFLDVLKSGQMSTPEPLFFTISTAGFKSKHKFGHDLFEEDRAIYENQSLNKSHKVVMFYAEENEDWENEEVWKRVNPSIGEAGTLSFIRDQYEDAKLTPRKIPHFKAYHLNMWTDSGDTWIDMHLWEKSGNVVGEFSSERLDGRPCWAGLDLSTTKDLTAFSCVFKGSPEDPTDDGYTILVWTWGTEYSIESRSDSMKERIYQWRDNKWITIFPGNEIIIGDVEAKIIELSKFYDIQAIGVDKWNAKQIGQNLEKEGLLVIDVPQNVKNLHAPTELFETLVLNDKIYHGFNPVLTWNLGNAVTTPPDHQDRFMVSKKESKKKADKIDAIAATMNAFFVLNGLEEIEVDSFFIPWSPETNFM